MTAPVPPAETPHPPRCPCALCTVEDALALLDAGRVAMARVVLEPLPGRIREALARAGWRYEGEGGDVGGREAEP